MKQLYVLTLLLCFFIKWNNVQAQTTPSIMDANVAWTNSGSNFNGILTVYLTDSSYISGVQVSMGSQPDSSDIYTVSYSGATNGNFGNNTNVTMQSDDLTLNMGSFAYHSNYYVDIKVYLQDNAYKEIQVHSSN